MHILAVLELMMCDECDECFQQYVTPVGSWICNIFLCNGISLNGNVFYAVCDFNSTKHHVSKIMAFGMLSIFKKVKFIWPRKWLHCVFEPTIYFLLMQSIPTKNSFIQVGGFLKCILCFLLAKIGQIFQ